MKTAFRCALLSLGLAGCLDLSVLQSGANPPDMALPVDMAMPVDMVKPVDMVTPPVDMAMPDMATPTTWTNVTPTPAPGKLYAISGNYAGGMTTIYVASAAGAVLKSTNGTAFSSLAVGGMADLLGLWVKDASTVYVVDNSGNTYATANGGAAAADWANKMSMEGGIVRAVYGQTGTDSVLIGGANTTRALFLKPTSGTTWSAADNLTAQGKQIYGIFAGATYYVTVGDNRAAKCTDPLTAATCAALSKSGFAGSPILTAVHGTADNNVWIVTEDGNLAQSDLTSGTNQMTKRGNIGGGNFAAVWVKSANEVWIAGSAGGGQRIWMWDGATLQNKTGNLSTSYVLTGIWGDGNGNIWVVGNNGNAGGIFKH